MGGTARVVVFALLLAAGVATISAVGAGAQATDAPAQVQLVSPGASPRRLIRLTPKAAPTTETVTYRERIAQSGAVSQVLGPLKLRTVISAASPIVGPGGVIRAAYAYTSFGLLPTSAGSSVQLKAVRTVLGGLRGLRGELTTTSTGAVLSQTVTIPPSLDPTVQNLLQQFSHQARQLQVPFPTEAVGIGARWRVTTHLDFEGIDATQTYEYRLRRRTGSRLTLSVSYLQTAKRSTITFPALPSGAPAMTVTQYRVTGTGTTVLDTSQILPVRAHVVASGRQAFRFSGGNQSQTLTLDVQFGIDSTGS